MAGNTDETTTAFAADDRLDKLPPLTEQYTIDDLLTEHFGFAPKVFTGSIFNIINEAIYDTVACVEEAVLESYFPKSTLDPSEPTPASSSTAYPSKDDIARSLNQLETLLCSSIDNQFDLLEIWLHRNVFSFPFKGKDVMKHFRFSHMSPWEQFYHPSVESGGPSETPDWEKLKAEEEELWSRVGKTKSSYFQEKDDYHSLLAVSKALDKKLAGLKAVSSQLDQITSEATTIYDPETRKPLDLSAQSAILLAHFKRLVELDHSQQDLHQAVNSDPQPSRAALGDELADDDSLNQPTNHMARYQHVLNQLTKAKINDFLAEMPEKGSIEAEKVEGLLEIHHHTVAQGKAPVPDTPLHRDRL